MYTKSPGPGSTIFSLRKDKASGHKIQFFLQFYKNIRWKLVGFKILQDWGQLYLFLYNIDSVFLVLWFRVSSLNGHIHYIALRIGLSISVCLLWILFFTITERSVYGGGGGRGGTCGSIRQSSTQDGGRGGQSGGGQRLRPIEGNQQREEKEKKKEKREFSEIEKKKEVHMVLI